MPTNKVAVCLDMPRKWEGEHVVDGDPKCLLLTASYLEIPELVNRRIDRRAELLIAARGKSAGGNQETDGAQA
ncbi:hypothetical protein NL676_004343 [Syzygium grande]|nr:hypothetical protein NL676_004343 [Syzygium grande]